MSPVSTLVFLAGSIAPPYEPNNTFFSRSAYPALRPWNIVWYAPKLNFPVQLVMEYDDREKE